MGLLYTLTNTKQTKCSGRVRYDSGRVGFGTGDTGGDYGRRPLL